LVVEERGEGLGFEQAVVGGVGSQTWVESQKEDEFFGGVGAKLRRLIFSVFFRVLARWSGKRTLQPRGG
jgi:hypothetical protein